VSPQRGPRPTRLLVEEWLAANSGRPLPTGAEIARQIGRPNSYSHVSKILKALAAGAAPPAPNVPGSHRDYAARGETRRRVQEYLDKYPGVELSNVEMARTLGLNQKTVGQAMRAIIADHDAAARPSRRKAAPPPVSPPAAGSLVVHDEASGAAARQDNGSGVTALMLRLQAVNFADVPLPPGVLIRQPGGPNHRDGVARDGDGRWYELREL
jgi:DNA-binding transcriptional ArsR family regulator